ncbi:MAG TPA: hypothetical protein PKD85_04700, partial [Saprospiraceae bacterium]|nr:hypothetical protein [Saprospiraceae bacterium]
ITGTLNQITSSAFQGALTLATPNTFLAPGTIQDTSGMYYSTTSGISASGATQGAAAPLTTSYNVVTTTPSNTGVRLPTPNTEGLRIVIVNRGVNTLRVYPDVGGSIDSVAINGYVEIPSGTTATYEAATTIQWFTVKDVIVSGAGTTVVYDNGRTIVNASGVSTFSAGTTGLTPVAPTNGAVVLSGILNAVNGGTGQSAYTVGDLLYASGASTLSKLVSPTTGNALISGGVGVAPLWGKINLTSTVSGVLPVSNGGTGQSTYSVGDLLYASGASTLSKLVSPVTGNLLKSGGLTTAPFWGKVDLSNDITGILSNAQGGTGLNTSTAANGTLLIGNGSGLTLSTLTTGTGINVANGSGTIGISNTGVLSFSAGTTGLLPVAPTTGAIILAGILNVLNGGTGLSTYTIGDTLYASGATTISKLPAVATGNALISGGISTAPLWGKINLGNTVSGILPAANGGTGQSTYTIGDLLFANTISTLSKLPAVATGNALISTGIGVAPNWGKINLSTTASGTLQAAQAPAFTGNVTSAAGSLTLTIANAVVTNAKLANMPSNRIKGNNTGGVTSPIDLTTAQTTAMLDLFTSTLKGLVPSSGGGTSNFLRADGTWTAPPGAGGSPGGANTNVQYNNGGTFGGSNAFNFVGGANPVVNIQGTASTTQLTVGGTANTGNATSYIEVASKGSSIEGLRCYFNRGTPGINGWITYDYDGSTPNIRITDEDDDPPYIQFNVIGGGTYQAPKFSNVFGGRGPTSGATTGFSWKVGGAEISTMDSNFFLPPTGTSGFRPAPATNGMMRYNTTTNKMESYVPAVWQSLTGIIDKSTTTQTTNAGGSSNMVSYVVPGGTLSNNNILRVRVSGLWVVGSTNRNVTIGISYGGATLWQSTSNSPSNGSNPSWFVYFDLLADNNTNAQILNGQVFIGRGVNATAGFGSLSSNEVLANTPIFGSSSINSNLNQTLIVNVSIESGSNTWFKNMHTIELL